MIGAEWPTQSHSYHRVQDWVPTEVRLCRDGRLDHQNFDKILITEETHRIRSRQAVEVSRKCADQHPLPAMARGGGLVGADPRSQSEEQLSRGPRLLYCSHVLYATLDTV